jgi:glutathione synthase/RimK-type ligase-like ATP-grasp enzyme
MPNLPFLCQFMDGIVNVPVDPLNDFLAERSLSPTDRVEKEKVLILTKDYDPEANLVGINLRIRGIDYVRLNVNDVPHRLRIRYSVNPGSHLRIEITVGKQILETSEIQVILLRHFDTQDMNYYSRDEPARIFSLQQWEDAFQILQNNLNCEWISDPYANRQAGDRIKQLLTARDLGLAIPTTMITNDPSEARDFYHSFSGNVVLKAIHHHSIQANGKIYYMYTHELLDEELARLDDLVYAPCILQQKLIKKSDLRVTVVGTEVFATQIDSPMNSNGHVDLHRCPLPQLSFKTKELDDTTCRACVKFIQALGLKYGAIDFVEDEKNDQPIFLELNPTGDWYWIERKTGQSITKAMVDLIEELF